MTFDDIETVVLSMRFLKLVPVLGLFTKFRSVRREKMVYWGCMLILAYYAKIAKTLSYKRSDADFFLVLAPSLFCLNAAEEGLGGGGSTG